jgi:DNA-binding CsgD family transcriptional regulator
MGFGLCDTEGYIKSAFSLDRTTLGPFTTQENAVLSIIQPHLKNLYEKFYVNSPVEINCTTKTGETLGLTNREAEIVEYLSQGITPENISKKLFISPKTLYRHIANIHSKLNIKKTPELIVTWLHLKQSN